MRKVGVIFIVLGLLAVLLAAFGSLLFDGMIQGHKIMLFIFGSPFLFLGIAFQFITSPPKKRKVPTLVIFIICLLLFGVGAYSNYMDKMGARIELLLAAFLFCFTLAPLISKFRYEKWSFFVGSKNLARGLTAVDLISIICLVLGMMFKIQLWPGASFLMTVGVIGVSINLVGWNRILGQQLVLRKTAEAKLEIAHDEIMDSIAYAKRIQTAILPPDKLVKSYLKDSFILYKPKDVVAGDFYWMEVVGDTILFAAADCTGHGVPGAMVSVICNNALNRSVREFGLIDPAKILDKAREIVIAEFEKSEEEVKDGMDISLCAYQPESMTLSFAGAHNPLWLVRQQEIIETKGDKQPVGKFDNSEPFTTKEIPIQKGDHFYVFSDGYVDQFGGERGKKFKAKALRKLLLSFQDKGMKEQCALLETTIESWRGKLEQVDDICFIGVKVR